jgi:hypothetical protein
VYQKAEDALQRLYFVGLQEEFQISSELLLREMAMTDKLPAPEIKKERDQSTGSTSEQKAAIKGNVELMRRAREVNHYDLRLYAKGKFVASYTWLCACCTCTAFRKGGFLEHESFAPVAWRSHPVSLILPLQPWNCSVRRFKSTRRWRTGWQRVTG